MTSPWRLSRIGLNTANSEALAQFFEAAFGFTQCCPEDLHAAGDKTTALTLGPTRLDLISVGPQARPAPTELPGWSLLFQHFAIVTSDMAASYERLKSAANWTAISTQGPVQLPPHTGGVTAFKFRDPEGHPLELIEFAASRMPVRWRDVASGHACLGIDHTAISVADTARSVAFYANLGMRVGNKSLNFGAEQERLDGIARPTVEVTSLQHADQDVPHVELLAYRGDFSRNAETSHDDDVAATRLIFTSTGAVSRPPDVAVGHSAQDAVGRSPVLIRDPDGHLLAFEFAASC